ncbi:MAG: hypothetical protein Q7J73_06180 [Dehalococcoidales bacterium]|nr:hypothetical protein [Dehalococcoidales bacterium]
MMVAFPMDTANPNWLGYIVLFIVGGSLFIILLAAVLVKPRKSISTVVFIGMIFSLYVAVIGSLYVAGKLLALLIPS